MIGKRIVSTRSAPQRHDPRGERDGGAGGDEPICRESEVAHLPAADDVALGDVSRRQAIWSIPPEAFAYYRHEGVPQVVCEEKHMGSRAVVIVCRDEEAARKRFGIVDEEVGIIYTRTGRRFFNDKPGRRIPRPHSGAVSAAGFWDEFRPTGCASTAN